MPNGFTVSDKVNMPAIWMAGVREVPERQIIVESLMGEVFCLCPVQCLDVAAIWSQWT